MPNNIQVLSHTSLRRNFSFKVVLNRAINYYVLASLFDHSVSSMCIEKSRNRIECDIPIFVEFRSFYSYIVLAILKPSLKHGRCIYHVTSVYRKTKPAPGCKDHVSGLSNSYHKYRSLTRPSYLLNGKPYNEKITTVSNLSHVCDKYLSVVGLICAPEWHSKTPLFLVMEPMESFCCIIFLVKICPASVSKRGKQISWKSSHSLMGTLKRHFSCIKILITV